MCDFLEKLAKYLEKEDNQLFEIIGDDPVEFMESIKSKEPIREFHSEVIQKFNLRTLFDHLSHEWHDTTMDEKVVALQMIKEKGFKINMTVDLYREYLREQKDESRLQALNWSLGSIIEHLI